MASILRKVGQSFNVPVHIYEADSEEDMNTIDLQEVPMGSKCHIINDGKWYMLNSERKWKAMPSGGIQPDWNQNDGTAKDYIKNRPGGYTEEYTTFPLVINATKQDGINKLTIVHAFEEDFIYKNSINVEISNSSGTINRTLAKRHIPEYIINELGTYIYGNAHLIDARQPDTGEDLAIFYEDESHVQYNIGWHVWATSVPSGDLEIRVVEERMHVIPFSSEFMPWEASPTANSVLYTAQSLTEEEQAQARANIGAGTPYTLPQATSETIGGVKADSAEAADTQPVRIGEDGKLYTAPGGTDISLGLTSASVGQTIKVKAVDDSGKPTAWEAADMPSGGGTKMEEVTETVTVSSENVTLDSGAPSQTVNLAWSVPGSKTIPAFTNYYIENSGISYPRAFNTSGYTQFWGNAFHGNAEAFVSGHQYFQAFHYIMDGDSTAEITLAVGPTFITPTAGAVISGSGWVYMLATAGPGNMFYLKPTSTGTGTIDYLYCIDVTALQEAGTITATTINELAELFGGLELIPGQNYEGSTISGTATLSITRDGETTTVDSGTATATVQGGDILAVEGGSVTFLLKVLREVYVDPIKVWSGKKWVAFGDSLTDETINADKKYYRYIEEKTGITVVVMGKGGTGYYKTYDSGTAYGQRMANVPADADVITIFGSVNDWHTKSANVEMGNASDTMEAGTLAGYINECIDVAIEKAPYAQIALVTPMDYKGLPADTLEGIANIIKAVAAYRQIKCLDLYHESGFRVRNPIFAAVYTTDYSETAESYGHPSNLAHEQLIAPEFMELLKRMLLTA